MRVWFVRVVLRTKSMVGSGKREGDVEGNQRETGGWREKSTTAAKTLRMGSS